MPRLHFNLNIAADHFIAFYEGRAKSVSVVADNGQRIEFPAMHLRPFLTRQGIHGRFEIEFDKQNRFVALKAGSE